MRRVGRNVDHSQLRNRNVRRTRFSRGRSLARLRRPRRSHRRYPEDNCQFLVEGIHVAFGSLRLLAHGIDGHRSGVVGLWVSLAANLAIVHGCEGKISKLKTDDASRRFAGLRPIRSRTSSTSGRKNRRSTLDRMASIDPRTRRRGHSRIITVESHSPTAIFEQDKNCS